MTDLIVKDIYIPTTGEDPADDNVDVFVTLQSGERYVATFFTLKNIQNIMDKWARTGEYSGRYFWASDMIIARGDVSDETIRQIVEELVATDELRRVFTGPLPDD
jgi:hypothetical protein